MNSLDGARIEKDSSVPIYAQVERLILDLIGRGTFSPGRRLPSERELADRLGISRMTVRTAISNLVADEFLYSVSGKGTFVSNPKLRQDLLVLTSFTEDMRRRGMRPGARLLDLRVVRKTPPKVYESLRLPEDSALIRVHRLRLADGEPMCIETSHLPHPEFPWLLHEDLESGSLYQILESRGVDLRRAEQRLEAGVARGREAKLLTIPPGAPVLHIERVTYTDGNRPIEYVRSIYRGDRYQFSMVLMQHRSRKGDADVLGNQRA